MTICKITRSGDDVGPNHTLFACCMIFGVCNVLFVSYVVLDYKEQQDESKSKINEISKMLKDLQIPKPANDCLNGRYLCKEIKHLVTKSQRCEKKIAIMKLVQDQMEKKRQFLEMWDNVPKPFIHTVMGNPSMKGKHLHGWNTTMESGEHCEGVDPEIVYYKGRIRVKVAGHYYIYSQITFQCPPTIEKHKPGKLHRHSTERLRRESDPLMTNSYQLCGAGEEGKLKVSYQRGIYKLGMNDLIVVTLEKPEKTLFVDDGDHKNDMFFGAYLV